MLCMLNMPELKVAVERANSAQSGLELATGSTMLALHAASC
jgi:hypothetical protein